MRVKFEILGRPVAKERARTMKGYTYTPPRTRAYEEHVAMVARSTGKTFDGDIRVFIDLRSKAKLRGDIDNYAKCVLDGMVKGGLISDDRQIVHLNISKINGYSDDRVLVEVVDDWT